MTATLQRPAPTEPEKLVPSGSARVSGDNWHWLVSLAVFTAVILSSFSLNGVLLGWSWLPPVAVTVGTALLLMALARTARVPALLVPFIGVLGLLGSLIWQFFPRQSIMGFLPGPGLRIQLEILLNHAEDAVVSQVAPVLPGTGIFLIACAGIGLIAVLGDTLATTLRMPALSGLALFAVLVVPAVVLPGSVGMPGFVAAAAGFLLILGCAQWRENRRTSAGTREVSGGHLSRGLSIGALALTTAIVLPLAIPGFNSGAFPQGARVNLWGTATGLNPMVTLGNDLRDPTGFGRITYATDSEDPLYLRSVTLEDFSGQRWEPDQRLSTRESGLQELGTDAVRAPIDTGVNTITQISAASFTSPWLLAPYAPVGISSLNGRWSWDPQNMSVLAMDGGSTAQQTYTVHSAEADLTRELLSSIAPAQGGAVNEQFLALPQNTPGIIGETTAAVTEGISNPYDQAIAIQNYLRGPDFLYSVDAPVDGGYDGSSLDVMARFLESKSGYCVHYAGTMAVMARLAGIPSRVAVGYAPGTPTGESIAVSEGAELREYAVDSRDAHAWPELYFENVGWVQFEPTPSRGVVPDYALSQLTPADVPDPANDDLRPGQLPAPVDGEEPAPEPSGEPGSLGTSTQSAAQNMVWTAGAVLLIGALALAPFLLRTARTNRRRSQLTSPGTVRHGATLAWAETTEIAGDYGYPAEPTDTPRTFAGRLKAGAGLDGGPAGSLGRLRRAYEEEEYAGPDRATGSGHSAHWDDVQAVTGALRRSSKWPVRLKARFLPRSLWRKFRRGS